MKTLCEYLALGLLLTASPTRSQTVQRIPADTLHWDMEGRAQVTEYKGRKCILLDGGAASIRGFAMRDGVIDVDVATTAKRGFFGIQFHIDSIGQNGEWVYLRPHKSGLPDAIQYTPVLNTGLNWQIYNDAGFTAAVDIPKEEWFHLRLVIAGASATFYVKDMESPALVMTDLKCPAQSGAVALASLIGASYYANVEVRTTPDAPWVHRLPHIPAGTITRWKISPSYDALQHDLERPLTPADIDSIHWKDVDVEPPGFVVLYRYYRAPHIRVTFANDFSKRLEPQPGMRLVYARTIIESDHAQLKKLSVGYSDDVSVFLNGRILWRGRSAQNFRDPGFLGIMNPENDAVYLQLKKGKNELILAVSELGGGWGFICRVADVGEMKR